MEDYLLYPADSIAGQWRGIYFSSALNSNISHAEIKNAIINLAQNPKLVQKMGANGIKAIKEIYNWSIEEKKLLALYRTL